MSRSLILISLLFGCADESEDSDTIEGGGSSGACGETSRWDVSVVGTVRHQGEPLEGAMVVLEDRGYNPGEVLGTGVTDTQGGFQFEALEVVSIEDCWGTLLNYFVVAESGTLYGEKKANTYLHTAIYDESLEADMSGFPVDVE